MERQAGTSASAKATIDTYDYTDATYGINASTTGDVYGIYDMSGGNWERVAAYVNTTNENLKTNGQAWYKEQVIQKIYIQLEHRIRKKIII